MVATVVRDQDRELIGWHVGVGVGGVSVEGPGGFVDDGLAQGGLALGPSRGSGGQIVLEEAQGRRP